MTYMEQRNDTGVETMSEQCLVDAAEAARQLGIAKSSLYRMAATGVVPSYAVGPRLRGRRFDVQEVRAALRRLGPQLKSEELIRDH